MSDNSKVKPHKSILFAEDPNSFNINENIPNSIANYEDMYIDVSLTAQRKRRSVLSKTGVDNESEEKVSFMGFNQNVGDNNKGRFTTKYYDGSNPDGEDYESFGITSINISINSSFIPVVKIQFVDIRGLSFFNRKKSPYRLLFDFPPPIFNLVVKGYYGQALEYKLHLVKYQPSFKSENGNFIIDAEFVAVTFAPLSDILFRNVVNGAMIDGNTSFNSSGAFAPNNTYDFILKLKELYTAVNERFNKTNNINSYDALKVKLQQTNELIESNKVFINNTENNLSVILTDGITSRIIKYDDINQYIDSSTSKIYVGYPTSVSGSTNFVREPSYVVLNTFTKKNKLTIKPIITFTFQLPQQVINYTCVDFKEKYKELNNEQLKIKTQMGDLAITIKDEVNSMVDGYLGMKPTIYNVFELLLKDVDSFFSKLRTCSEAAETHHNLDDVKPKIISSLGSSEDAKIDENKKIYSFPLIIQDGKKISPKRISDNKLKDNPFPEILLIDKFVRTFAEQARLVRVENMRTNLDENGVRMWIPITPLDTGKSPYTKCVEAKDFFDILLKRFYILTQFVYPRQFYTQGAYKNDLVIMFGQGEAYNLLLNQSLSSLDSVKLILERYTDNDFKKFNEEFCKTLNSKIDPSDKLPLSMHIQENSNDSASDNVYIDKKNDSFRGCRISDSVNTTIQESPNETLSNFIDRSKNYSLKEIPTSKDCVKFTNENVLYLLDNKDGDKVKTRFLHDTIGEVWADLLLNPQHKYALRNVFNDVNISKNIKATLILSNFEDTITPYDVPGFVGIFEIPSFVPAYFGLLLDLNVDDKNYLFQYYDKIKTDYNNITTYMSEPDKTVFRNFYNKVFDNSGNVDALIEACINLFNEDISHSNLDNMLDEGGKYYDSITKVLMERKYLEVFTEKTFSKVGNENSVYTPYTTYDDEKNNYNNQFFKHFRKTFLDNVKETKTKLNKEAERIESIIEDEDIFNQTYYSFKNINDKWLTNESNGNGYIFNEKGENGKDKGLIDSFVFVDRALNDIGDTIINPESLIEMFDDTNISIFTVISRLLSDNHFEFFPLQNFIYHDEISFEKAFKIDTSGDVKTTPAYVCMHIGGTASYLSDQSDNGFNDDGVLDLRTAELGDFSGTPNVDKNNFFKRVMAFNVSFGKQNQSMFKDIEISGSEHAETNESLQILSRLAGDEQHVAPIPKGQNLYNLYENRSYSATVSGLGNAMIQPTQYFQLENIPMFNGAYIILSVEHQLTPNMMTTKFTGTKIAKYPTPYVKDSSTIINFEGSIGEIISSASDILPDDNTPNPILLSEPKKLPYTTHNGVSGETLELNAPVNYELVTKIQLYKSSGHYGIDFAGKKNTPIWAARGGIVKKQGYQSGGPKSGHGWHIVIEHDDNTYAIYSHLVECVYYNEGDRVNAGVVIGKMGNTGDVTTTNYNSPDGGTHLHFEFSAGGYYTYNTVNRTIDPKPFLKRVMGQLLK